MTRNPLAQINIRLPLAGINFFLADVAGGLGPYLAIYLITAQHWHTGNIGLVLTISGIITIILQTPAGIIVDTVRFKRTLLALSTLVVVLSTWAVSINASFITVMISQIFVGAAAAFFGPVIAAITLGLVGSQYFSQQFGENQGFNHAGNVFAAALTGLLAYFIALKMVFYVVILMGLCSFIFVGILNKKLIDHEQARSLVGDSTEQRPAGYRFLFENKALMIFGCSVLLFHLANAAMLILVGEEISVHTNKSSVLFVSGSIISAQFIMLFMALLVKLKASKWGRKPIFLIAFLALPIRGILFTLSSHVYYLLAVQLLDGVGAGIYGALFPVVVEDLTLGSGRYNMALGIIITMQGIGAALSNLIAGYVVEWAGFNLYSPRLASVPYRKV